MDDFSSLIQMLKRDLDEIKQRLEKIEKRLRKVEEDVYSLSPH